MKEALNPIVITSFIKKLNKYLDSEIKKINHYHNSLSYFSTGQCNVYGLILNGIFQNITNVTIYDNSIIEHIITQIGENCYDVYGLVNKTQDYKECPIDYLYEPTITNGIGNYDPKIHDKMLEDSIKYGKELLVETILKYTNNEEKQKASKTM